MKKFESHGFVNIQINYSTDEIERSMFAGQIFITDVGLRGIPWQVVEREVPAEPSPSKEPEQIYAIQL